MAHAWPKEIASGLSITTSPLEWADLNNRRVQARIHEAFGHVIRELAEAMQHLDGSKSWKDNPRPVDVSGFNEEIVDALHFFVEMCVLAGIDAEDLFRLYFEKNVVNHNRVEQGY
jgi:dimeric dUTPase (all-alpha-NTP-PPase superfamily)